ncbi:MAG: hypothetical protein JW833_13430, partial [Prolixibacteraceae bacterium]|nr:hypothetical protein [Prolixibacteraceae bacterium]
MFEAGVLDLVDVISFHPYSASFNTYNRQIEKILKISNDYSHQKKYWITEIGYPTGGFYPWRSSLSKYPEKVVKTLIYGLSENIDKIFWYELFDGKKQRWYNSEDHFGLAKKGKEYDYKKGAYAFKAIAGNVANSLLVNSKVECNLPKVEYNYFIKNNGEGILVLWSERKYRSIGITIPGTNIRKISIESSNIDYLNDGTIHCSLGKKPLVLLFELKKEQNETIKIDTL